MSATLTSDSPSTTETPCACDHCGLPVPAALRNENAAEQFCCAGCRVAYEVINGCGLADYYRVRNAAGGDQQSSTGLGDSYAALDSEAFLTKHATDTAAGLKAIEFRLEGVHCAACVWLVERLPSVLEGVVESRLSLASCSARVVWDPEQVALSRVAATLDRFGYAVHPARDVSARDARLATERRQLMQMAIAGALAGNNMLIAIALYAGVFDGIAAEHSQLFRGVSMLIGWLSVLWPGAAFFRGAIASLRSRTSSLDQPITLALSVGALAGTVNVLRGVGEVYFDSLSVLVFLLLVGRFLQARQQRWATDAVGRVLSMTPDACRVVRNGQVVTESVEALLPGDTVEVLPGEVFPADGRVASGVSSIDASLMTGESTPRRLAEGDEVYSGAVNVSGVVRVTVSAAGDETRLGQLQLLVMEGLNAKTPLVQFTDRIGRWFLVVVVMLATLNAVLWTWSAGVSTAVDVCVAVLIVACPCALGLATPLTMALAIGRASRDGVLIKSADVLERLAKVTPRSPGVMMLDKTGTLTTGQFEVVAWHGDESLIGAVAAAEQQSNHPLGYALVRHAESLKESLNRTPPTVHDCETAHGYGLTCRWQDRPLVIGSPRWVREQASGVSASLRQTIDTAGEQGLSCVAVALDSQVVAVALLRDQPHADSREAVRWLSSHGWRARILSGDHPAIVEQVAAEVGVAPTDAAGAVTPEEKYQAVCIATEEEEPRPMVAMVGDGVNDAAALAAADVGIAVHGGAEAALAAADVYLSRPGIGELARLIGAARRTLRTVHRNLGISLAYNAIAVALASAGWVTPLTAAVLMPLSSATVLASAISGVAAPFPHRRSTS